MPWCVLSVHLWPEILSKWTVVGESTVSSVSLSTRSDLNYVPTVGRLGTALWIREVRLVITVTNKN